jgi:protein-disulfide reductase (glutathione)
MIRGWGEQYVWQPDLATAQEEARRLDKPLMLIIHKSWCGACKKLKAVVAEDQEILEMSEQFVMMNVGDDDEPAEERYKPDGGYIPRILFFKPDGTFLSDIINTDGNPKFKYYHYSAHSVADSMEDVTLLAESWREGEVLKEVVEEKVEDLEVEDPEVEEFLDEVVEEMKEEAEEQDDLSAKDEL